MGDATNSSGSHLSSLNGSATPRPTWHRSPGNRKPHATSGVHGSDETDWWAVTCRKALSKDRASCTTDWQPSAVAGAAPTHSPAQSDHKEPYRTTVDLRTPKKASNKRRETRTPSMPALRQKQPGWNPKVSMTSSPETSTWGRSSGRTPANQRVQDRASPLDVWRVVLSGRKGRNVHQSGEDICLSASLL